MRGAANWAGRLLLVAVPFGIGRGLGDSLFIALANAAYCGAYLMWSRRHGNPPWRFPVSLILQAGAQIVTRGGIVLGAAILFDFIAGQSRPTPAQTLNLVLALASLIPAWAITIAWWRSLSLASVKRYAARAASCEVNLPGAPSSVIAALGLQLDRLRGPDATRLRRGLYQADLHSSLSEDHTGASVYRIWWSLLPLRALVRVSPQESGALLSITFALRGGLHRLELFPNPCAVLPLMRYLETQLIAPVQAQLQLTDAREREERLRLDATEAQLRILQAQIEPHFFFNSLANVRQLYRTDVRAGEEMLNHLISYLRGAMQDLRAHETTVKHELDLAAHYLAVMKVRFGERLAYRFNIHPGAAALRFPAAMLISLVENALIHGLREHPSGEVDISATLEGKSLRIAVADNGPGISSVEGTGTGLSNIRQRLEAMYGAAAQLVVGAPASGGFEACIMIPVQLLKP